MQLHPDELSVSEDEVQALVARRLPELAGAPIRRVEESGTDHHLFRLGGELVLRLPRRPGAEAQTRREARWLPRLAPHLPLPIPEIVAFHEPDAEFGHGFGLYRWIAGQTAVRAAQDDPELAEALAGFVRALRAANRGQYRDEAPLAGRGGPLRPRHDAVLEALASVADEVDAKFWRDVWADSLAAAPHVGPPVWLHGDLIPGNLLLRSGRLAAIIDFGGLGIGDPAADLIPAWAVFGAAARQRYRQVLGVGQDEWRRGMGWALSFALIALPYYRDTHPVLAATARRTLGEIARDMA
ncbi:MAG: aminoglycoside phosphotransferase family protein [Alphaproteobacteria bacterium]|nr:aminoglycoside phosphotransferase family protein [Alphaproteobacteria bacterium]